MAVLYFENNSADTSDVYLADGLTEDITAKLGQINRLGVTARAAMRQWRGRSGVSMATVGRTMNVSYLVSGSVQRSGNRVRVSVELIRAATGARVWGDQYDRATAELLTLQQEIAQAVARGITGQLLPTERELLVKAPTRNPEAYDHYLRGNRLLWRSSVETNILAAIAEYRAALHLDSSFTMARGRLSSAYGLALNWSLPVDGQPTDSVLTYAFTASNRALSEDSTVGDAWIGRAMALFFRGRREDVGSVLEAARRAVELNPGDDGAHQWYSSLLRRTGHFAEAEHELHRSLLANPARVVSLSDLAFLQYSRHRFAEARSWIDSALALDSTLSYSYVTRARIKVELRDPQGALQDAEKSLRVATPSDRPRALAVLAEMSARNGQAMRGERLLDSAFALLGWPGGIPRTPIPVRNSYDPALAAITLGRTDLGITILEHARPRGPWLWSYLIIPGFDSLRADPRFSRVFEESKPL